MGEELLERPFARDDTVALEVADDGSGFPLESCGDYQQLLRQLPSCAECDRSFLGVRDDVHHVAEVYDIGRGALFVGKECGVPSRHGHSHLMKPLEVTATAASVVEERRRRRKQAILKRESDGTRQRPALDRGLVGSGGTHLANCVSEMTDQAPSLVVVLIQGLGENLNERPIGCGRLLRVQHLEMPAPDLVSAFRAG